MGHLVRMNVSGFSKISPADPLSDQAANAAVATMRGHVRAARGESAGDALRGLQREVGAGERYFEQRDARFVRKENGWIVAVGDAKALIEWEQSRQFQTSERARNQKRDLQVWHLHMGTGHARQGGGGSLPTRLMSRTGRPSPFYKHTLLPGRRRLFASGMHSSRMQPLSAFVSRS
jgi:hypothetical protein